MRNIFYLDHAATSFPKAPGVSDGMKRYLDAVGANIQRGAYAPAAEAAAVALETREALCALLSFDDPARVIFTPGQTYSLNLVLKGLLAPGDHAIVSSMEHNAVMRPLVQLSKRGVTFSRVPRGKNAPFDLAAFPALFTEKTRLVAVTHASNVSGEILPLEEIGRICAERNVPLLVDAAQTAGHYPVSFADCRASALAVPGHKGLLGPSGVGTLLLSEELAERLEPLVSGGTGSMSDSEEIPAYLPDKFEAGTLNLPGVYGLHASLAFLASRGVPYFRTLEEQLTRRFLDGLAAIPDVRIVAADAKDRVGVVSVSFLRHDNADAAFRLESECGVLTRVGLHCAPAAHKALGTFPQGTVRFSFGYGNAAPDVDAALDAVRIIAE